MVLQPWKEWVHERVIIRATYPTTDSSLTDEELSSDISSVASDPPDYGSFDVYQSLIVQLYQTSLWA